MNDECFVDHVFSHKTNLLKRHSHTGVSETLYQDRCKGFLTSNDTWERMAYLTSSQVLVYQNGNNIGPPPHLKKKLKDHVIAKINGNTGPENTEAIPAIVNNVVDLHLNGEKRLLSS